MPRYFFNLKTSRGLIRDFEGMEFPDESSARGHARDVAHELMRNHDSYTPKLCRLKLWRLDVCDNSGVSCFELLFASLHPAIGNLPPEMRASVEDVCRKTVSLNDSITQVRRTLLRVKGTLAKADRAPYIATLDGVRL